MVAADGREWGVDFSVASDEDGGRFEAACQRTNEFQNEA